MIDLKKIAVISFLVVLLTLTQVESLKNFTYIAGDNIALVQNETSLTISANVSQNVTANQSEYFNNLYVNYINANNMTHIRFQDWVWFNNTFFYLYFGDGSRYIHYDESINTLQLRSRTDLSQTSDILLSNEIEFHNQSNKIVSINGTGLYSFKNVTVTGNLKGDTLDNVQTIRLNSNQSWINFTNLNIDELTTLELTMKTRNAHTSPIYIAFYINDDFNPRNYTQQYFGGDGSSNFAARSESDLFDFIGVDNSTIWNLKIEKAIDRGYYTFGTIARSDRGIVSYVHTTYISGTGNITSIKMNTRTGAPISSTVNGFKTGTVSKLHRID